ncbi:MAG TPA: hypothetical protein VJ914_15790 [Pseudonocardiaceae bacterium]|nr:hypothetical protein [Pseudonocardiaceae bacterium]
MALRHAGAVALAVSGLAFALAAGVAQATPLHADSAKAGHSSRAATSTAVPAGSLFTPMTPLRVLDTRDGTGTGGVVAPVGAEQQIKVNLTGKIPASATAIVLNLTGTNPTSGTYVTVQPNPNSPNSNLNLVAGETRANAVTVAVDPSDQVQFFNFAGSVDLVADLAGYYTPGPGAGFTSTSPTRVLDTRAGTGTGGVVAPVGADSAITLDLSGQVPAAATAVTLNLTGVDATAGTYVTAWPDGAQRPLASNLNLVAGEIVPNQVTVELSADRKIDLYNFAGTTDLVADLAGYYATGAGNPFYPLTPIRALDTRDADGNSVSPIGPDQSIDVDLSPWLPAAATAAEFNLTGTNTTDPTYVTAWPAGTAKPLASNLNLVAGQTAANLATVALGNGGHLSIGNFQGNVDVLVDLAGYFAPAPAPCTSDCVLTEGDNFDAQLGDGTTATQPLAIAQVPGLSGVTSVAASYGNTYALGSTGTVYAWGRNDQQELGNGKIAGFATVPAAITGLPTITAIAAGADNGYALDVDHHVWAWGDNGVGELGIGSTNVSTVPVEVNLPAPAVSIASSDNTAFALLSDGTVWSWGYNQYDRLGNGTGCADPTSGSCFATSPVQVSSVSNAKALYATQLNSYVVESDGSVWAWGWNAEGELGIGTFGGNSCYGNYTGPNCGASSPVAVPALSGVTKIAGGSNVYAIKADGTVLAWGDNSSSRIGNGVRPAGQCNVNPPAANCYYPTPFALSGLSGITDIDVGVSYAVAIKADGTAYSWGFIGEGPSTETPAQMPISAAVSSVSAGWYHVAFTAKTP